MNSSRQPSWFSGRGQPAAWQRPPGRPSGFQLDQCCRWAAACQQCWTSPVGVGGEQFHARRPALVSTASGPSVPSFGPPGRPSDSQSVQLAPSGCPCRRHTVRSLRTTKTSRLSSGLRANAGDASGVWAPCCPVMTGFPPGWPSDCQPSQPAAPGWAWLACHTAPSWPDTTICTTCWAPYTSAGRQGSAPRTGWPIPDQPDQPLLVHRPIQMASGSGRSPPVAANTRSRLCGVAPSTAQARPSSCIMSKPPSFGERWLAGPPCPAPEDGPCSAQHVW